MYSDFVASHPNMPAAHLERFLAQIERCRIEAQSTGI
jgi:hypothetical protein